MSFLLDLAFASTWIVVALVAYYFEGRSKRQRLVIPTDRTRLGIDRAWKP